MNQSGYADLKNENIIDADSLVIGTLILPSFDPNSIPFIDKDNILSDVVLNDGQLIIGRTGNGPVAGSLTGIVNQINVQNGSGSIGLSLPQDIATTSSPTFNNIHANNIIGSNHSTHVDHIVSGPTYASSGDLCYFDTSTGLSIADSTIPINNVVQNSDQVATVGDLASFSDPRGQFVTDSGIKKANVVQNMSTGTLNNLVSFVSDKVVKDTGIPSSQITTNTTNIATNTANIASNTSNITTLQNKTQNQSATAGNTNFSGILQQAGVNVATTANLNNYVLKAGDSMTGTLNMTSNNISNVGTLSGSNNSRIADNILSSLTNSTYGNLPMFSTTNKQLDDSLISSFNVVTGPATATNNNLAGFNLGTGKIIKDIGIASTNVFKVDGTVAMAGVLNQSNTTDSTLVSNGSIVTLGGIGLAKSLTAGSTIKTTSTVDASSTITGALQSSGGLGVAKKAYIGDSVLINTTSNVAKMVVSGGVQNVSGEDSCIRAISAANSAKIELQNTTVSTGKLYECRSLNNGNFDITDRTGAAIRFIINTNGIISIPATLSVGKGSSAPIGVFEAVGAIFSTSNGGSSDKELSIDYGSSGQTYGILSSYQQGVGDRDLQISMKNLAIGTQTPSFGGGYGGIFISKCQINPSSNPANGFLLYVDLNTNQLKARGPSGTTTVLANP